MVGCSADNMTPLFLIQTQIPNFNLNCNQWPLLLESKRAFRPFSRNVALKFHSSRPNANQSAHLKARVVAWLCAPRVHVGDMYQGCWPWVHFSAQVSLWAEPNWDGECILVKILSNLIKTSFQYWGWCKYCYREHTKGTFTEAKECTR